MNTLQRVANGDIVDRRPPNDARRDADPVPSAVRAVAADRRCRPAKLPSARACNAGPDRFRLGADNRRVRAANRRLHPRDRAAVGTRLPLLGIELNPTFVRGWRTNSRVSPSSMAASPTWTRSSQRRIGAMTRLCAGSPGRCCRRAAGIGLRRHGSSHTQEVVRDVGYPQSLVCPAPGPFVVDCAAASPMSATLPWSGGTCRPPSRISAAGGAKPTAQGRWASARHRVTRRQHRTNRPCPASRTVTGGRQPT